MGRGGVLTIDACSSGGRLAVIHDDILEEATDGADGKVDVSLAKQQVAGVHSEL